MSFNGPADATRYLLQRTGINGFHGASRLIFSGEEPIVSSPNAYGCAAASALGALSLCIAEFWRARSGRDQEIEIDLRRAVLCGLRSVFLLQQNGSGFTVGSVRRRESNFFRTRDGRSIYLVRMLDYAHLLPRLLGVLRCSNDHAAVTEAVGQWNADELEEALARTSAFGVVSRSPSQWLAHPQGAWLAARPGLEVRKMGDSRPEPPKDGIGPLGGMRVLDASHVIAGPTVGRTLAEHGAEVLRVAAPYQPDLHQVMIDTGFGKRSAFIDLDQVEDTRHLRDLASNADVFIESWRPGAMRRKGFGPEDLAKLRPGIVYVSLSCFGDAGPWAARGGYEPIGQVASGLATLEGSEADPRLSPTITMNDYLSAYLAAAGAAAALLRRSREGGSYHVTTSLTQSSMWVLQQGLRPENQRRPASEQDWSLHEGWMTNTECAFGDLRHISPVVDFSETTAAWRTPPEPFGASQPLWAC